jgi:regulator of replication initiation timing
MNPTVFQSGLLNEFPTKWSIKKSSDTTELLYFIDIKVCNIEKERNILSLDVIEYKAKCEAFEKENNKLKEENEKLKKRLDTFENPN